MLLSIPDFPLNNKLFGSLLALFYNSLSIAIYPHNTSELGDMTLGGEWGLDRYPGFRQFSVGVRLSPKRGRNSSSMI